MRRNRRVVRLTVLTFLLPVPVAMAAPPAATLSEQVLGLAGVPVTGVGDAVLPTVLPLPGLKGLSRDGEPVASLTLVGKGQKQAGTSVSAVAQNGIPAAALRAYRNAEATMSIADPSCRLRWGLLAGVGRIESDHGRFGGAVVRNNGRSTPEIVGVALDGAGDVAAIADTDDGRLDGDRRWDRAVGPMQFIPSTWAMVGIDGDGDGERNPHDLDDAALAAAAYLCVGDDDLSTPRGVRDAIFRYNHSGEYVALVLAVANAYQSGMVDLPVLTAALQFPTGAGVSLGLQPGHGEPVARADDASEAADSPHSDEKQAEERSRDRRAGDSKSGDEKSGDSKSGDEKSGDRKSGDKSSDDSTRERGGGSDGPERQPKHRDDSRSEDTGRHGGSERGPGRSDQDSGTGETEQPEAPETQQPEIADESGEQDAAQETQASQEPADEPVVEEPVAEEFPGTIESCGDLLCLQTNEGDEFVLDSTTFDYNTAQAGDPITVVAVLEGTTLVVE